MNRLIDGKILALIALLPIGLHAQIFTSEGSSIYLNTGAIVHCNGGVDIKNGSLFTNHGNLRITKNSTFAIPGSIRNNTGSNVDGNGSYYVEQDWINNADFNADASTVYLYGNTEQFITSSNGTITEFNNLILQGTGSAANRKKTLAGVDARISTTGNLVINNRELATETNDFVVLNTSPTAVSNAIPMGAEGFVSSIDPGYLNWSTNSSSEYIFPVGSSDGTLRYRAVSIRPTTNSINSYNVRLNNASGDAYGYPLPQHASEINDLNANYFHSIERASGVSNANIKISYLPSADGDWSGIAQWTPSDARWNSTGDNSSVSLASYSAIEASNWSFSDPAHPYVLINLADELVIPNVFTPNLDGINDGYLVTGMGLKEFSISIVNRWGELVFTSDDITVPWDGTSRGSGNMCNEGVYFYVVKAKSSTKEYDEHGHITLILE